MLGVSEDNIEFLRDGGRRYIIGTPKSMLMKFEQDILQDDWHSIRDGLEVKFVTMPASDSDRVLTAAPERATESQERFILCRSRESFPVAEVVRIRQRSELLRLQLRLCRGFQFRIRCDEIHGTLTIPAASSM